MSTLPTTAPELADLVGTLDAQIKALEKAKKDAIEALAKRKSDVFEGGKWTVVRTTYDQDQFDSKGVKEEMGEDWYKARCKTSSRTRFTVKPTVQAAIAA